MSQIFDGQIESTRARVGQAAVAQTYQGPERRSKDSLNMLGRRLNAVCVEAVDPLQIAASLEASGLDDELVASRYGIPTIFELADHLYYRVPLRVTRSLPFSSPNRRHWREISHGLLFAMPGVFYPAAVSLTDSGAATLAIVLAVILGWAWSQAIVRVGYLLQGRGLIRETAAWLRFGVFAGITVTATLGLAGSAYWPEAGGPALLAVGQMTYQMAAAVLIMYEKEEWLFVALLPGILGGAAFLLEPGWINAELAISAIALSVGLSLFAAWMATASEHISSEGAPSISAGGKQRKLPRNLSISERDIREAAPFLVYGALCALLVSFDTLRYWQWIGTTGLGLTIAPLVLSMGVLEWQLRHFRERVAVLLARTHDPVDFSDGVWRFFLAALTRYALLLAGLSVILLPFLLAPTRDVALLAGSLLANWFLGCAFFIGFALISQGRIGHVTLFMVVALSIHFLDVSLPLHINELHFQAFTSSYVLSCLLFAILLSIVAKPILCEIHTYRYDLEVTRYGHSG